MFPNRNLETDHTSNRLYQLWYDDWLSTQIKNLKVMREINEKFLLLYFLNAIILLVILYY